MKTLSLYSTISALALAATLLVADYSITNYPQPNVTKVCGMNLQFWPTLAGRVPIINMIVTQGITRAVVCDIDPDTHATNSTRNVVTTNDVIVYQSPVIVTDIDGKTMDTLRSLPGSAIGITPGMTVEQILDCIARAGMAAQGVQVTGGTLLEQ